MMKRGDKVTILRGLFKGETGELTDVRSWSGRVSIQVKPGLIIGLAASSVKLVGGDEHDPR